MPLSPDLIAELEHAASPALDPPSRAGVVNRHFFWADSPLVEWDPDHHPSGAKLERRAIQLGLRAEMLQAFGRRELVKVLDVSAFVAEQRERLSSGGVSVLVTPRERVYRPADPAVAARLRLAE